MANFVMSATIKDGMGVTATQNINLQVAGTQTVDNVGAEMNSYLPLLDAITDGKIESARLIWEVDLPAGLKASPVEDSAVEKGMLVNWKQANSIYKQGTYVPAVSDALLVGGKIDLSNADYIAWRDHLLGLTAAIKFVSKFLNAIQAVIDVLVSFRKHRKPANHVSFETP